MDKHRAMIAFFKPKIEEISAEMNFNFSDDEMNSVAFLTKEYSPYKDDVNLQAMEFAQSLMDWVDQKNRAKEYPDFPDTCEIQKIETLQNMPNLAGVNMEQTMARYMFQCRVTYFEREVRK